MERRESIAAKRKEEREGGRIKKVERSDEDKTLIRIEDAAQQNSRDHIHKSLSLCYQQRCSKRTLHLFGEKVMVGAIAQASQPVALLRQMNRRTHQLNQHLKCKTKQSTVYHA